MEEFFIRLTLALFAFFSIYFVTTAVFFTGGDLLAGVISLGIILSKERWIHVSAQST